MLSVATNMLDLIPIAALTCALIAYLGALTIYRLYFHPLARLPGPLIQKVTAIPDLWHSYVGNRHTKLFEAHQKYGPVVRFGPDRVSFNTAEAFQAIHGHTPTSQALQKGRFYLAFPAVKGVHNTHNAIDKAEHARKRRVLSMALSDRALQALEQMILDKISIMTSHLTKSGNNAVDMGKMFSWLTFDIMGELCFGRAFGMLENPAQRFIVDLVDKASHNHFLCGNYLALMEFGLDRYLFPGITSDLKRFMEYGRQCANERMAIGREAKRDVFYHLLDAKDPVTGEMFSIKELWAEANVLTIAGSDTTATAMSALLFYLCRSPEKLKSLQKEIRSTFRTPDEVVSGKKLGDCHYLRACIDEALRLSPPVPGLLPREVIANEGCVIDGVHIPKGTDVGINIYALHHNPDYFPDPFSFLPERWLGGQDAVAKARSAFGPFLIGPRGCIGKSVAYMELRLTIARLVLEFNFVEHETEGKGNLWREGYAAKGSNGYRLMDHMVARREGPMVLFEKL